MTVDGSTETCRIVLIGPESTGKTWLAGELAARYAVPLASEYVREYVEARRVPLDFTDVDAIGRGQVAAEDAAIDRAVQLSRPLVILDTDLVSTLVYSLHYYGRCPEWLEREARRRLGDLYLLHHTDVGWAADGHQREQPERREELFGRFQSTLRDFSARVTDIKGPWEVRRAIAIKRIDRLLAPGG